MQFTEGDIEFLCNATSLSCGNLLSLVEEDFDLLIDAIPKNEIAKATISLPLYTKLVIFREAKGFDLADKSYVSDCVTDHYPRLHTKSHYLIDCALKGEEQGQYYLVLAGLFPEFLQNKSNRHGGPAIDFYISIAKNVFKTIDRISLADHIHDWVYLLNQIKANKWK